MIPKPEATRVFRRMSQAHSNVGLAILLLEEAAGDLDDDPRADQLKALVDRDLTTIAGELYRTLTAKAEKLEPKNP